MKIEIRTFDALVRFAPSIIFRRPHRPLRATNAGVRLLGASRSRRILKRVSTF